MINSTIAGFPPGAYAFIVTATTAANQTTAGATYYLAGDVIEPPIDGSSNATGEQVRDRLIRPPVGGALFVAGIIVGAGIVARKRQRPRNGVPRQKP